MTGSTISTDVTTQVTLGSASYSSPLTITNTGEIDYASPFLAFPGVNDIALTMPGAGGVVLNYGKITETQGHSNAGFEAVLISGASTLENFGVVLGQSGGIPGGEGAKSYNAGGGAYLSASGASLLNAGTVTGGIGGLNSTANGTAGTGGYGVKVAAGGNIENASVIDGGSGGRGAYVSPFNGGTGGVGINIVNGTVTNDAGAIVSGGVGGIGSTTSNDGVGGAGVLLSRGSLTNSGTIVGGNALGGGTAGDGLILANGTVTNLGVITGGAGATIGAYGASITSGELVNTGVLTGSDAKAGIEITGGTLINAGTVNAGTGGVAIGLGASPGVTLVLEDGSFINGEVVAGSASDILTLGGTSDLAVTGIGTEIIGFGSIALGSGAHFSIEGNKSGLATSEAISGFTFGDSIDLTDFQATTDTYVSGTGIILSNGSTTETLSINGSFSTADFTISSDHAAGTVVEVTCYARGTRIATKDGDFAVEDLAIGDSVKTLHNGLQKVKWIGQRSYTAPFANHVKVLPICIRADAIADGIPQRDLFVSPGHAICIDGVLVHALNLVNGVSITQAESVKEITYFHVELETHEVIFAEGCPAETFMGEYFRQQFHNAAEYQALYPGQSAPEVMCLERLDSGFHLHAIRLGIAARAGISSSPQGAGMLQGFVDQTGPNICFGWAQDMAAPEEPVCLDIFAGGERVGRVLANLHRADVRDAGFGSGRHGFEFVIPPNMPGPVDVRRSIDGASLPLAGTAMAIAA